MNISTDIPSTDPTSLLVVIVNYRVADLVINCLRSLVYDRALLPKMQVVIVDNHSGDGSVEKIVHAIEREGWEGWVSLIASKINGGFAYGNNLAIRPALQTTDPPLYFLLLNPDTEAYPNTVKALIDFMEEDPEVGITVSAAEDEDANLWPYTYRFPTLWSELDQGLKLGIVSQLLSRYVSIQKMSVDRPQLTDWFQGACMMVRRQVFEEVGLMDEAYFLYYEETDFCLQAKRAGWSCWYVPQSRIWHLGGQSTGYESGRNTTPQRLPQYWFASRRHYFVKNYGWFYTVLTDIAWILGTILWRCRRVIQGKPDTDPPYLLWDFFRNSTLFVPLNFVFRKPSPPLSSG
jgi:N-acetylglucosaminyl-diphospho-decaprenol L-rhamnosyltransferase